MKGIKIISTLLMLAVILPSITSCTSSIREFPGDEDELATNLIEVNPQLDLPEETAAEPVNTASNFDQFYSLDSYVINTFNYNYNANSRYCIYDGKLIITAFRDEKIDDYNSNSYCDLIVYDILTGKTSTHNLAAYSEFVYSDLFPFEYNGDLYLFVYDYSGEVGSNYNKLEFEYDDEGYVESVIFTPVEQNDNDFLDVDDSGNLTTNEYFLVDAIYPCGSGLLVIGSYKNPDFYDSIDEYYQITEESIGYLDEDGVFVGHTTDRYYYSYDAIFEYGGNIVLDNMDEYFIYNKGDFSEVSFKDFDVTYLFGNKITQFPHDTGVYVNSLEGLYYVDSYKDVADTLIDYNCVVGDAAKLASANYLMDEDGYFYFYGIEFDYANKELLQTIYKLSPIDNPYGDKAVIRMACNGLDEGIVNSIHEYNMSDNEYFIEYRLVDGSVPNQYGTMKFTGNDCSFYAGDATEYYNYTKSAAQVESMEYSIIKDGSFDLLYNFGDLELFNTDRICLDLNEYKDEWNNESLYENVLKIKENGSNKLFQMPLGFVVDTLSVLDSVFDFYYDPGEEISTDIKVQPLSLEEYEALIEDYSYDPLHSYVCDYECLTQMISNDFNSLINTENKSVNFSRPGFEKIFEFAMKDVNEWRLNPPETVEEDSETGILADVDILQNEEFEEYWESDTSFEFIQISSILDFAPFWFTPVVYDIYGTPSVDDNLVTARTISSIAVYNETNNVDECIGFISYLLEGNSDTLSEYYSFSINRDVNVARQNELLYLTGAFFEYFPDDSDEEIVMSNVENFINSIDSFGGHDYIIETVILQSLIDYSRPGSNVSASSAINTIEQAVQSVLDRY